MRHLLIVGVLLVSACRGTAVPSVVVAPQGSLDSETTQVPQKEPKVVHERNPDKRTSTAGLIEDPAAPEPARTKQWVPDSFFQSPLHALCPDLNERGECPTCPEFTSFSGADRGPVLEVALRGSFQTNSEEALIAVKGCEPHSYNWGGFALVRNFERGWAPVGYLPGLLPSECTTQMMESGTERLVCREFYHLNGPSFESSASVWDFTSMRGWSLASSSCSDEVQVHSIGMKGDQLQLRLQGGTKDPQMQMGCVIHSWNAPVTFSYKWDPVLETFELQDPDRIASDPKLARAVSGARGWEIEWRDLRY